MDTQTLLLTYNVMLRSVILPWLQRRRGIEWNTYVVHLALTVRFFADLIRHPLNWTKLSWKTAEMITMKSGYLKYQLSHPYRISDNSTYFKINDLNVSQNFHVDNIDCFPTSEKLWLPPYVVSSSKCDEQQAKKLLSNMHQRIWPDQQELTKLLA